ncbi:MAG: hypothetical protein MUE72_04095 [Chitinophagaceae bacterium]|nr:hypothetical protein [Chitinophagaceae bacterium]
MKRILTIVLCFVLLNKATAQADKIVLDNVFQHINKATIPTGYLQDYGAAFVNKESYNGILTDSNAIANLSAFRLMYNDVYTSKINPMATSMPNISAINSTLEPLQGSTATPLIFHISNYAGFHPDAILNNMITYNSTTQQFHPIAGQNPWVTNRFFAATPIDEVSPTQNSITLTYNSSLVFSNCGKQISTVSINFYEGAGYQNLALGGTLTQAYTDSSGYKPFAIKVVCTDGSVYECYSLQYVYVSTSTGARFTTGNILPFGGIFSNTAPTPHNGTMQIIYSRLRQGTALANQLVKPLIIINGLDETDIDPTTPASNKMNLRKLLEEWGRIEQYDFNGQLDDIAGYDLIYINYYTLDKIEHNADMLISMLNWINANKVGTEQNVVMGIELGGLISRYALAKMTRNTQPHQTRLLITHDAPHQGAYMPLGYQHLAEDFGEMDYWGTPFRSMISDYQRRLKLKNSPVFLQFYLHKVDGATVSYNSFLAPTGAYQTMVNFAGSGITPTYQFVATSQGSQCGTQVMRPGTNMLKYEEKIDDDPFAALPSVAVTVFCFKKVPFTSYCMVSLKIGVGFGVAYKTKLSMSALPNVGTTKEISYAAMEREIFVKIKVKVCVLSWCLDVPYLQIKIGTGGVISQGPFQRFNPSNILPYESFAGSTNNLENFNFKITGIATSGISWSTPLWKDLATYLGLNIILPKLNKEYNVIYGIHTFSYISRVSALDIVNPVSNDYSKLLALPISGLNRSSASKFLCHEGNNNGGITSFNIASGRFTKSNATWMFNEMQGIANSDYCFSECGKPYISGPSLVSSRNLSSSKRTASVVLFMAVATIPTKCSWSIRSGSKRRNGKISLLVRRFKVRSSCSSRVST